MRLYEINRGSYSDAEALVLWGPDEPADALADIHAAIRLFPYDRTYDFRDGVNLSFAYDDSDPTVEKHLIATGRWKSPGLVGIDFDKAVADTNAAEKEPR